MRDLLHSISNATPPFFLCLRQLRSCCLDGGRTSASPAIISMTCHPEERLPATKDLNRSPPRTSQYATNNHGRNPPPPLLAFFAIGRSMLRPMPARSITDRISWPKLPPACSCATCHPEERSPATKDLNRSPPRTSQYATNNQGAQPATALASVFRCRAQHAAPHARKIDHRPNFVA